MFERDLRRQAGSVNSGNVAPTPPAVPDYNQGRIARRYAIAEKLYAEPKRRVSPSEREPPRTRTEAAAAAAALNERFEARRRASNRIKQFNTLIAELSDQLAGLAFEERLNDIEARLGRLEGGR